MASCGSEEAEVNNDTTVNEPSTCHCNDLVLDNLYNWYYLNDRQHPFNGTCTVYHSGEIKKVERSYVEGKVHGIVSEWFANGQLMKELNFDMNLQHGEAKNWNESGDLTYHANYKRGELDTIFFKAVKYINQ